MISKKTEGEYKVTYNQKVYLAISVASVSFWVCIFAIAKALM